MRTRFLAAMMAAMLLGNAVHAQTLPPTDPGPPARVLVPVPAPTLVPVPAPTVVVVPAPLPAPAPDLAPAPTVVPSALPPPAPEGPGVAPPPPAPDTTLAWPTQTLEAARRPSLMHERLRLLDATLIPLSERSRDARITEGILGLVVGAALITLGAIVGGDSSGGGVGLNSLLYLSGGFSLLQGGLDLFWVPARERLARQYQAMPRATSIDRRAQVRFGEQSLEDMAADGARRRVLGAVGNFVLNAAMLVAIYNQQIFDGQPWPQPPAYNYLIFGVAGISVITGLIGLLSRSEEERLRDTYRRQLTSLQQIPVTGE